MRLSVASLRRRIKGKLQVEFVDQELTSYSGLELLRRYLRQLDLAPRLRAACASTGGDYGGGRLALLILALFYVGARRLEHLRCGIGSEGGQRLSMGDYVKVRPSNGATPPSGVPNAPLCWLRSPNIRITFST